MTAQPNKKVVKNTLQAPKGMHDVMFDEYYLYQGFFEKAQEVAVYYGFRPIETPLLEDEEVFTTSIGIGTDIVDKEMYSLKTKGGDHLALRPEYTAGVMRAYLEHGMGSQPQPLMLYSYGPLFRHDKPQRGRFRQFRQFNMEMIGSEKSVADAMIIKSTVSILEEAGAENLVVDINSMGDKESRSSYVKELTAYYRKHVNDLAPADRERLKVNPLRILDSKEEKTIAINQDAPDILSFLNPSSKRHFKEVLEYLEELGIPYRVNKTLVRGLSYYTHTVFEIIEESIGEEGESLTIAAGGRYDYLAKSLGSRKDVYAIGVALGVDRIVSAPWYKKLNPRILKKPKMCFIQLGAEAKLKSLNVIEILRKAHVPMVQSLSKDSLSQQLAIAEKLGTPYAMIFGQKEAIEKSVIIRNMHTHSQETVKLAKLAEHLKNM
jgi:histidyl-tRNA synthetase